MQENYWLKPDNEVIPPFIVVYRIRFELNKSTALKFIFSADERCELFLNGHRLADGPERGDLDYWYFQRCSEMLTAGKYTLTARVLCFGKELTAHAQTSIRHGFFLRADGELAELLDTGTGAWEYQVVSGVSFAAPYPDWGTFPRFNLDGYCYNWDILKGHGGDWRPAERFIDTRVLHKPDLPPMSFEPYSGFRPVYISDNIDPDAALDKPVEYTDWRHIPAGQSRRIVIAFDKYMCAWPEFVFVGGCGAVVRIRWAETLYDEGIELFNPHCLKGCKGNRSEVAGKYFIAKGSSISLPGGVCRWMEYWWRVGRYLEITVENPAEDLCLKELNFYRTGYPYTLDYRAECSSGEINRLMPLAFDTLQACSHETFMDCPYYEQLMYIGDARIEALCAYAVTQDSRLPEKALNTLLRSQLADGVIYARYPARVDQVITSFPLIYIFMLHDFAWWRNRPEVVRKLMPGARRIIDFLLRHLDEHELLQLPGWNFVDWTWFHGVPQGNCALNWMFVLVLERMAELEKYFGEPGRAVDCRKKASAVSKLIIAGYFNEENALFADDLEHKEFSEHPQVLALLTGQLNDDMRNRLIAGLRSGRKLHECTIYFSFYYLEACAKYKLADLFFARLRKWYNLEQQGLKTFPEDFEYARSDCHAWSSHVLFHYFASIIGIRPEEPGFRRANISPMSGPLEYVKGTLPHPDGSIKVEVWQEGDIVVDAGNIPVSVNQEFLNETKADELELVCMT